MMKHEMFHHALPALVSGEARRDRIGDILGYYAYSHVDSGGL
jgi:hypothetical protein